jgi:hypothetical protein
MNDLGDLTAQMHDERRRRRPTPREPMLSLAELLDASGRATPGRATTEPPRAGKDEDRSTSRRKQSKRSARGRGGTSRPSPAGDEDGCGDSQEVAKVIVTNMVAIDEIADPDERLEVEEGLRLQLSRHGRLVSLGIDDATGVVTAAFHDLETAETALLTLNGSVYGSRALSAWLDASSGSVGGDQSRAVKENAADSGGTRKRTKRRSKLKSEAIRDRARYNQQQYMHSEGETLGVSKRRSSTLVIRNLLDSEELEDDDEYEDIYQEVHDSLSKYGAFEKLTITRERGDRADDMEIGSIVVKYGQTDAATQAFDFYDGRVFGGRRVVCKWIGAPVAVKVVGVIDPEELEDPDEFDDVRSEVSEYFAGYKQVAMVEIIRESGDCIVECESEVAASDFISLVRASKYGGRLLEATRMGRESAADESKDILVSLNSPPNQEAPTASTAAVTELAIVLLQRLASLQVRLLT